MRIKATREKKILALKNFFRWLLYITAILFCFTLMMSGRLMKPVLLIPAAICVAMNTGELQAAFTGALCGLLMDIACGNIFGYNAVILTIACTFTSLMFINYLRKKFMNFIVITFFSALISGILDYVFYYSIWDYENKEIIFHKITMPVFAYTIISAVPVYLVFMLINRFFMPRHHLSITEAIKINREENNT